MKLSFEEYVFSALQGIAFWNKSFIWNAGMYNLFQILDQPGSSWQSSMGCSTAQLQLVVRFCDNLQAKAYSQLWVLYFSLFRCFSAFQLFACTWMMCVLQWLVTMKMNSLERVRTKLSQSRCFSWRRLQSCSRSISLISGNWVKPTLLETFLS